MPLVELKTNEERDNLSISLRDRENVVLVLQLSPKLKIVADDTIVDEGNASSMIKMRVCIHVCFVAMCCPARVTNRDVVVVLGGSMDTNSLDAIATEAVGAGELRQHPLRLPFIVFCD